MVETPFLASNFMPIIFRLQRFHGFILQTLDQWRVPTQRICFGCWINELCGTLAFVFPALTSSWQLRFYQVGIATRIRSLCGVKTRHDFMQVILWLAFVSSRCIFILEVLRGYLLASPLNPHSRKMTAPACRASPTHF